MPWFHYLLPPSLPPEIPREWVLGVTHALGFLKAPLEILRCVVRAESHWLRGGGFPVPTLCLRVKQGDSWSESLFPCGLAAPELLHCKYWGELCQGTSLSA